MTKFISFLVVLTLLGSGCQKAQETAPKKEENARQQPVAAQAQLTSTQTKASPEQAALQLAADTPSKENVPLITEVMTKEELQAYLKEKNIPIITKENFKEPELVWEKTFENEFIPHIGAISDITEKGNLIIVSGKDNEFFSEKKLLFIDNKGDIRKKINLGKIGRNAYAVAKGGNAAIVGKWKTKGKIATFTYYDEEGNDVWNKDIKLNEIGNVMISDNGESIAIEEGNINWSDEEWGGELNIEKVLFLDNKGKQLFEKKEFRNIGWGEFSGDGKYFAGLFWWQDDPKTWGKLVYIDVKEGKVLWEKPFAGKHGDLFREDDYLAISEHGNYVAAVDTIPADIAPQKADIFDSFEIAVFDRDGKLFLRSPGSAVYVIREDGLLRGGSQMGKDVKGLKGWIDINKRKSMGLFGEPPYFFRWTGEEIWEKKPGFADKVGRIVSLTLTDIKGDGMWTVPNEIMTSSFRFTSMDGMIVENGSTVRVYKMNIAINLGGHVK